MSNRLRLSAILLGGALLGSAINLLLAAAGAPDWLVLVLPIGLDPPFVLNLAVAQVTFGATLSLSYLTIVGIIVALIAFRKHL